MSLFIIKKLVKRGLNLKCFGFVECHKYIDGNLFYNFVENTFKVFGDDYKNITRIINCMTGLLNKKYESNNRGFITQSDDIANLGLIDNYEIKMEGEKGNRTYIACNKNKKECLEIYVEFITILLVVDI